METRYQRYYRKHKEQSLAKCAKWRDKNRERWREYHSKYQRTEKALTSRMNYTLKVRDEIFKAYGNKCACCGESEPLFLEIDHVNNDGAQDRKINKHTGGQRIYREIKRLGFPKDRFQLLCCNCNRGKWKNGGTCPHLNLKMEAA